MFDLMQRLYPAGGSSDSWAGSSSADETGGQQSVSPQLVDAACALLAPDLNASVDVRVRALVLLDVLLAAAADNPPQPPPPAAAGGLDGDSVMLGSGQMAADDRNEHIEFTPNGGGSQQQLLLWSAPSLQRLLFCLLHDQSIKVQYLGTRHITTAYAWRRDSP